MSATTPPDDADDDVSDDDAEAELYETVNPDRARMSRRDVLRAGAAAGVAATAGTGAATMTAAAQESDDGGAATPGIQQGSVMGGLLTGDYGNPVSSLMSENDASSAMADNVHDEIYARGVELAMWTDLLHTSVQNQLTMLSDFVRTNVQYRVVVEAANGATLQSTIGAAVSEAEESISTIEGNFLQAWTLAATQATAFEGLAAANSDLRDNRVFRHQGYRSDGGTHFQSNGTPQNISTLYDLIHGSYSGSYAQMVDYPLANGDTVSVPVLADGEHIDAGDEIALMMPYARWPNNSPPTLDTNYLSNSHYQNPYEAVQTWDGGSDSDATDLHTEWMVAERMDAGDGLNKEPILDAEAWMTIHDQIMTLRENEPTYAEDIANTLYEPASNGEITVEDVSGASQILEVADTESWSDPNEAAAIYRSTSIPEAKQAAAVRTGDGTKWEGILFRSHPSGDGLPVGEEIDPNATDDTGNAVWKGDFFLAAEATEVPPPSEVEYPVRIRIVDGSGSAYEDATARVLDDAGEVVAEDANPADGLAEMSATGGANRTIEVTWVDSQGETARAETMLNLDSGIEAQVDISARSMQTAEMEGYVSARSVSQGDIVAAPIDNPFTVTGTADGSDRLQFEERDLTQPSNTQEEMMNKVEDAAAKEEESQKELQEEIEEDESGLPGTGGGGGSGPSFNLGGDLMTWAVGGLVGLLGLSALMSASERNPPRPPRR